jgi:hypothetical protein
MRAREEDPAQRARNYREYLLVLERFVAAHGDLLGREACDEALLAAYARNARGCLWTGDYGAALRCGIKGVRRTRRIEDAPRLKELARVLARGFADRARRAVVGR